ncbi:unnamed protein product [Leptosia nina]|uniref:Histone-lysine N-methyltransferase, H3 lysine-36 and H4 lysine-20 specific n=1 Tax=Leptosia nina TaxID=320188 RepID=A0AAV1IVN2_9NEOP
MDETNDKMNTGEVHCISNSSPTVKPKKRSIVERELETSLTPMITSPITNGESTSRYGRARKIKGGLSPVNFEKTNVKLCTPTNEKSPNKVLTAYKMHAMNSPITSETMCLDSQVENIYKENLSLSRFGTEEKKCKLQSSKTYTRKDLIQTKEKEETVILIRNLFSPEQKLTKDSEINIKKKRKEDLSSVVKTLDFGGKKKTKEIQEKRISQSDLFDLEAQCNYQVGDLAWARMGAYPFWPCIISREPSSNLFVKKKLFGRQERDIIHVTFFGDNGRRGWMLETMLRKYSGLHEFESTRDNFTPEAKKKDPKLYAAFFVSEKRLPLWHLSIQEAEVLLREPKRLRIDILNDMINKSKEGNIVTQKSKRIVRTNSDVSLSESLYDSLFSEEDSKNSDSESGRRSRTKSYDVSDVVTACLDNMAAKTGITKIQKQSHMDRWLQKAKSITPEKCQLKLIKSDRRVKATPKTKVPSNDDIRYKLRNIRNESHSDISRFTHQNEHDYYLQSIPNGNILNENELDHSGSNSGKKLPNVAKNIFTSDIALGIAPQPLSEMCTEVISNEDTIIDLSNINEVILQPTNEEELLVNRVDKVGKVCVSNEVSKSMELNTEIKKLTNGENNCKANQKDNKMLSVNLTRCPIEVVNKHLNKKANANDKNNIKNYILNKVDLNTPNLDKDRLVNKTTFVHQSLENSNGSLNITDLECCEETSKTMHNDTKALPTDISSTKTKKFMKTKNCDMNFDKEFDPVAIKNVKILYDIDTDDDVKNEKSNEIAPFTLEETKTVVILKNTTEINTMMPKNHSLENNDIVSISELEQRKRKVEPKKDSTFRSDVWTDLGDGPSKMTTNQDDNSLNKSKNTMLCDYTSNATCIADDRNTDNDEMLLTESFNLITQYEGEDSCDIQLIYDEGDSSLDIFSSKELNLNHKDDTDEDVTTRKLKSKTVQKTDIHGIEKLNKQVTSDGISIFEENIIKESKKLETSFNFKSIETKSDSSSLSSNFQSNNSCNIDLNYQDQSSPVNISLVETYDINKDYSGHVRENKESQKPNIAFNNKNTVDLSSKFDLCENKLRTRKKDNSMASQDKNGFKNPGFLKYLEEKQDVVMDENPNLAYEDIKTYLYKTWQYQEGLKLCLNDFDQSKSVKGLDGEVVERKSKKLSLKKRPENLHQTTIDFKSVQTSQFKVNLLLNGQEVNTLPSNCNYDEKESNITAQGSSEVITNKIALNKGGNLMSHQESNQSELLKSNICNDIPFKIVTDMDDTDNSKLLHTSYQLEETSNSKLSAIHLDEKEENVVDILPDTPLSNRERPLLKQAPSSVSDSDDHKPDAVNETDKYIESKDIDSRRDSEDSEYAPSRSSTISKEHDQREDFDTISIKSSSEVRVPSKQKTRKEKQTSNKHLEDPEFLKYLELRQDQIIDEQPELSQAEIVTYLYNTWSYEENKKSEEKKSDDLDQGNLVKGLNSEPVKKLRKKVKVTKEKEYSNIREDTSLKDKSKRRTERQFYREDYSDIEDEIELFQSGNEKEVISDIEKISSDGVTITDDQVPDEVNQVEEYFRQLTESKPNLFKGLVRERVCEICEKVGNLVKCKGCYGMFHTDCTAKVVELKESPVPIRGRKKKRKYKGRKPKGLDDSYEDHSDDKSQEHDMSFEYETETHTVINAEEFEQKLSEKLKELIDNPETKYDSYSSDDELDWSDTEVGRCKIVDIIPKKKKAEIVDFKCRNCEEHDIPLCFVCKSVKSPKKQVEHRQKCQIAHCNQYYHIECLEHWPQTQFNSGERSKKGTEFVEGLHCPRHVCHTCVCDDPRGCKTRFSGDKLARCVRCPATYHTFTKCIPAGTQILSGSHIICPRHYEHRPGKVPCHVNTGWCFICALGGTLICCEYCPTSFHAECLNIEPPEGGYMCEDCETGCLPLYGEMVWVKLGHYRWWPGLILHPSEIPENVMVVKHYPGEFVVRFFGQYDYYWVNRGRVFPFQEGDTGRISNRNSKIDAAFATAVEHAQRAYEILKNASPSNDGDENIASSLLPPHYVKLKVNKPCGSLINKKIDLEESSLTQCDCNPNDIEPCGLYSQCLNRMLLTECGPICRAGDRCCNRAFEKRQYPRMEPYRTPARGWGLRTLEDIRAGQFVIEYVGELIDEEEFQRRMKWKHEVRDENYYFLTLDKERMIDAGPKGNLARFMNHSCDPNCETQKWTVLGDVRVGLFALFDIPAKSEITFNYNLECAGIEKKRCMCGTKRCSGFMGAKPKQEEPKKSKVAAKRTYKKRKTIELSPTPSKPKRGRPKNRELTEIEKDLLIIKNATNGLSSDSESSGRLNSLDSVHSLKRKRVKEDNGFVSPSTKKSKGSNSELDSTRNESTHDHQKSKDNLDAAYNHKVENDQKLKRNRIMLKHVERTKLDDVQDDV